MHHVHEIHNFQLLYPHKKKIYIYPQKKKIIINRKALQLSIEFIITILKDLLYFHLPITTTIKIITIHIVIDNVVLQTGYEEFLRFNLLNWYIS